LRAANWDYIKECYTALSSPEEQTANGHVGQNGKETEETKEDVEMREQANGDGGDGDAEKSGDAQNGPLPGGRHFFIGNGDVYNWWDAVEHWDQGAADALMIGR
jgi:hypothetical protein